MRFRAAALLALLALFALVAASAGAPPGRGNGQVRRAGRKYWDLADKVAARVKALNNPDTPKVMYTALAVGAHEVRKQFPRWTTSSRLDLAVALFLVNLNGLHWRKALVIASAREGGKPVRRVLAQRGVIKPPVETGRHLTRVIEFLDAMMAAIGDRSELPLAGAHLDKHNGRGTLFPKFNDKTNNQPFHCAFFLALGYVAAGRGQESAINMMANIFHEHVEGVVYGDGGTPQDFHASQMGLIFGSIWYKARTASKENKNGKDLYDFALPAVALGGYTKDKVASIPSVTGATLSGETKEYMLGIARSVHDLRSTPLLDWQYYMPLTQSLHVGKIVNGARSAVSWVRNRV